MNKVKDFTKKNYHTLALAGTMGLAGAGILSPGKAYTQALPSNYNNENTKTEQVDTLWGKDNSTPDSVAYNVFSRPNIVKTYGKEGNDPNLNWEEMTPKEKANYFTKTMKKFIELFPKYDEVNNWGDTILTFNDELCHFYTTIAEDVIAGENNIENDPNPLLNKYSDIKQKSIDNNGFFNLPHLYITDISGDSINPDQAHTVSAVFLKNKITQNTSIEDDLEVRDSRTNYSAMPGTLWMEKKGSVNVNWEGYSGGEFVRYDLMNFQFDKNGKSYLTFISPKLITINPHLIHSSAEIPKNIDYSSDWTSKLEKEIINTTNQDTTSTIHTDNTGTQVDISYLIKNKLSYSDTTDLHNATDGTFPINVTDTIKFIQKGILYGSPLHPNGWYFYTVLKEDVSKETVNVTKNTTGIFNHKANKSPYKAYPNPMRKGEDLHLVLPQKARGQDLFIQFYDVSGRLLGEEKLNSSGKDATINTSRYNLPSGVILLKVTDNKTGVESEWKVKVE